MYLESTGAYIAEIGNPPQLARLANAIPKHTRATEPSEALTVRWRNLNLSLLRGVAATTPNSRPTTGTRVALHGLPSYMGFLNQGIVLGYPSDSTTRIRVAVEGIPISSCPNLDASEMVVAPLHTDDIIILPTVCVAHHLLSEVSPLVEGERIVVVAGGRKGTKGTVRRRTPDAQCSAILVQLDDETEPEDVDVRETSRLVEMGDRVEVVGGHERGTTGRVSAMLRQTADESFGGGMVEITPELPARLAKLLSTNKIVVSVDQVARRNASSSSGTTTTYAKTAEREGNSHWLCVPNLAGKRVDVDIGRMQPMNATRRHRAEGKTGYIELEADLHEDQVTQRLDVHLDDAGGRCRIPVSSLTPSRTALTASNTTMSIHAIPTRVVIIGPSTDGDRTDVGEYAQVIPGESTVDAVRVKFARPKTQKEPARTRTYPLASLCRALNVDGARTEMTRFY